MSTSQPTFEVRALDTLIPYWRNPRRLTEQAVNALAKSLSEYGYNQPIVVDGESVIIIGHTRYTAMRRLGVKEASVMVVTHLTKQQAKQLRVLDNRSGEYTSWDLDALMAELEQADASLINAWFPEVAFDPEADQKPNWFENQAADQAAYDAASSDVDFVCPACLHTWSVNVTREDVLSGTIGGEHHATA